KCLPHTDEPRATAGGIDDNFGKTPIELLGNLVSHRFFALYPVGFFEGRNIEPAFRSFSFRNNLSAVVDKAVHQSENAAVLPHFDLIRYWRVAGHENVGFNSCAGGVGGERTAGVACGWDSDLFYSQFFGARKTNGEPAIFERAGGILRLVLNPKALYTKRASQGLGFEERSASLS